MCKKYRESFDPNKSILDNLKLFEQTDFCLDFIKKNNSTLSEEDQNKNSKIASACFRQANEYLKMGNQATISTNPLLYSYALNNLTKGVAYLKFSDEDDLKKFRSHGFSVNSENLTKSLLNANIAINGKGAVSAILNFYGKTIKKQDITFNQVIRHIPEIQLVYFKTTGEISLIGDAVDSNCKCFIFYGNKMDDSIKNIFLDTGLISSFISEEDEYIFHKNVNYMKYIHEKKHDQINVDYINSVNLPEIFQEGIIDINISVYCYLLIMSYGMLVRYNPDKWETYVDKKLSKEAILIELSIKNAVKHFYNQIHYLLFDYFYINNSFSKDEVKEIINNSTRDIMKNINKEIKNDNLRYGKKNYLPW